jgi:hypothetical protein
MDSYEAGDQMGTLKAVKLWHYERFVDDVTGLIMEANTIHTQCLQVIQ